MKRIILCGAAMFSFVGMAFAAGSTASDSVSSGRTEQSRKAPAGPGHQLRMFAPSQCDSVLSLLPSGDSIKAAGNLVGIGLNAVTHDIVVVYFDEKGNPQKAEFPPSIQKQEGVAAPVSGRTIAGKKPEQTCRTWFILESALKSSIVYPVSYSILFHHTNGSVIGGVSLLTVGSVLYGSFAFTKEMGLGYGKVGMMNYGSTLLGGLYPQLLLTFLHNATSIDDSYRRPNIQTVWGPSPNPIQDTLPGTHYEGPTASDQIKAWMAAVGFAWSLPRSRWALVDKDDAGRISLMEFFSQTWGAIAFALPVFYYDHPGGGDSMHYRAASSGLSMALLPAGFWAGYELTKNSRLSTGGKPPLGLRRYGIPYRHGAWDAVRKRQRHRGNPDGLRPRYCRLRRRDVLGAFVPSVNRLYLLADRLYRRLFGGGSGNGAGISPYRASR